MRESEYELEKIQKKLNSNNLSKSEKSSLKEQTYRLEEQIDLERRAFMDDWNDWADRQ